MAGIKKRSPQFILLGATAFTFVVMIGCGGPPASNTSPVATGTKQPAKPTPSAPTGPEWDKVLAEAEKYAKDVAKYGEIEQLTVREAHADYQAKNLGSLGPEQRNRSLIAMEGINKVGINNVSAQMVADAKIAFPIAILRMQNPNGFNPPTPPLSKVTSRFPSARDAATIIHQIDNRKKDSADRRNYQAMALQDLEKVSRPSLAELARLQNEELVWYAFSKAINAGSSTARELSHTFYSKRRSTGMASASAAEEGYIIVMVWAICSCMAESKLQTLIEQVKDPGFVANLIEITKAAEK